MKEAELFGQYAREAMTNGVLFGSGASC